VGAGGNPAERRRSAAFMYNPPHPGEVLRVDEFADTGLTVTEFAKRLGVTRVALSRASRSATVCR